jgi:hypothetical protein
MRQWFVYFWSGKWSARVAVALNVLFFLLDDLRERKCT